MIFVLLEVQVAELVTSDPFCVALNEIVDPAPVEAMLIVLPEFEVTVTVELVPTLTVVVPVAVPEVAVTVTALVVSAKPFTNPLLLTLTWVGVALLHVTPLTLPVVPSLKLPVTANCCVPPICRFTVEGATVRLLSVGFTKKPRHPASTEMKITAKTVSHSDLHRKRELMRSL